MPKYRSLVVAAAVALVLAVGIAGAYAANGHSSTITKFYGVDESNAPCTTSQTPVNMPQASRAFTVGGTTNAPVVVMFSGSMVMHPTVGTSLGLIRLTVDNQVQPPVDVAVTIANSETNTVSFNWQTNDLTPGTHTARIQWWSNAGNLYCVGARSLIVLTK